MHLDIVIVFFLPETAGAGKRALVPFLGPTFFDITPAFRRIEKEGGGIYGDILGHSVILIEYEPAHIDRVNYTIIAIAWLRVVGLIS
jgi:hypothetical protein